jgi:hypothetical protein
MTKRAGNPRPVQSGDGESTERHDNTLLQWIVNKNVKEQQLGRLRPGWAETLPPSSGGATIRFPPCSAGLNGVDPCPAGSMGLAHDTDCVRLIWKLCKLCKLAPYHSDSAQHLTCETALRLFRLDRRSLRGTLPQPLTSASTNIPHCFSSFSGT